MFCLPPQLFDDVGVCIGAKDDEVHFMVASEIAASLILQTAVGPPSLRNVDCTL